MPERGTTPFIIDDLCQTCPLAFSKVLSIATMYGSIIFSHTNRQVMTVILSLMSIDMVEVAKKNYSAIEITPLFMATWRA